MNSGCSTRAGVSRHPIGSARPVQYIDAVIRATFALEPAGPATAEALAIEESLGMAEGPAFVRGRVVAAGDDGIAVLEFPEDNWGRNVPMLLSALVAGEGV